MKTTLLLALFLGFSLPASAVQASGEGGGQGCVLPDGVAEVRPGAATAPTPVKVSFYVIDIEAMDDARQSFTADFVMRNSWNDPRLGEVSRRAQRTCSYPLDAVWNPQIQIINEKRLWTRMPQRVRVAPDGTATYEQRFYGTLVSALDLRDFPFDTQSLSLSVVSFLESSKVELAFDAQATGRSESFSIAGWHLAKAEPHFGQLRERSDTDTRFEIDLSRLDYAFAAVRDVDYYRWKVVLPVVLIVLMSWAVFYIAPEHIGPRLGVATTSILTLIAFLFSLRGILPPISYLTRMDYFVYGSLALVFAAHVEALGTSNLALGGREALALNLDRWARVVWPVCFALVLWLFWI